MPVYRWSETAAANGTADPTASFPEGMAASALNDGARGLMAAVKMYTDDIAGAIVTAGTSTSYTVASYSGFTTLVYLDKQMLAFVPHTTNGAGPVTLNVDGLGAKALRSAPNTELPAGVLILGTPYVCVYSNTDGAFYLRNFYGQPYQVPIGGLMPYVGATPPNSSFIFPFGQAISRSVYPTMWALTGTAFGPGDGSTTFNVIDLRGRVIAGVDNMGGTAASRLTTAGGGVDGATLGATGGQQNRTLLTANLPPYTPAGSIANGAITVSGYTSTGSSAGASAGTNQFVAAGGLVAPSPSQGASTFTGTAQGGTSTAVQTLPPLLVTNFIMRIT